MKTDPWPHARGDAIVALCMLLLLLAWDASGGDLAVMRSVGDTHGFRWRDAWFVSRVLHDGGRWLGLAVLGLLIVNLRWPLLPGLALRERVWWLVVTLVCALLVPLIKQASLTSCPWDLAEFGGVARHVSHWHLGLADGGAGHCFPSGHATSAFALFSGWFVLRDQRPRLARAWLATVLLLGLAVGTAQSLRGAHYPSHTLWTSWLCWVLCSVGTRWLPGAHAA